MKKLGVAAVLAVLSASAGAADVGVSISIGQPGFYGQIDIGSAPRPQVIYPAPVLIQRTTVVQEPIYLRVPPGHAKHWRDHCREYRACDRPVYFVHDDWYQRVYVPHYREHHEEREYRHEDRYDRRHEEREEREERHGHRGHHHDDD